MKISIVQYYTENLSHGKFAEAINKDYCEKKGYDYYVEKDTNKINTKLDGRAPTWYKSQLILDVFENRNPDYVLFLDTDAIISDFEEKIESFIHEDYFFVAAEDPSSHSVMNAGVFLIKNNLWSIKFLNFWWDLSETLKPIQLKILDVDPKNTNVPGYFKTNLWMDQSALSYIYLEHQEFKEKIKIISSRSFNHSEYNQNNFIFHAYKYGNVKNRTLDNIYYRKFNIEIPKDKEIIKIVDYYTTDKNYEHNYFNLIYNDLFKTNCDNVKLFVDIGGVDINVIGLWRDYFINSQVVAINKNFENFRGVIDSLSKERLELLNTDFSKDDEIDEFSKKYKDIDIILDDGSHKMRDQQVAFGKLFKNLKDGGIYIIEDLHTSIEAKNPDKVNFGWGDPNKTITLEMLENFIKTKTLHSDYLTSEECKYLTETIDSIEIFRSSPNWSITSVIRKKISNNTIKPESNVYSETTGENKIMLNFSEDKFDKPLELEFDNEKLFVVYHCHLVNNWKSIVESQLYRLKISGLYDAANEIFVTVNLENESEEEFMTLTSDYKKLKLQFYSDNSAEFPAIKKVRELAIDNDCKILYLHTKGVSNVYKNFTTKEISFEKIKNSASWRDCMEYFLIDKWKESVNLLNNYDTVGVTCVLNWYWGNFWWANSNHIKKTIEVTKWDRWGYESWLLKNIHDAKIYEHFHFEFNGHLTYFDEQFYKKPKKYTGDSIVLKSAIYGTPPFELDEGYSGKLLNVTTDVTDTVRSLLITENNKRFNITVNNETMGSDPAFGNSKFLTLTFSPSSDTYKNFKVCIGEGRNFKFSFD